jgi:hypothetical protein
MSGLETISHHAENDYEQQSNRQVRGEDIIGKEVVIPRLALLWLPRVGGIGRVYAGRRLSVALVGAPFNSKVASRK